MIFVTGGTGFVGRHFIEAQLAAGRNVRALIRSPRQPPFTHERLDWRIGDITDRASFKDSLEGVQTVVHLAALLAHADDTRNQTVNVEATRSLLQLCRLHKINRFIFMSAAAATFRHKNAYGRSKRKAEDIVASSGIDYAILRAPLIVGRGSEEWERFVDYLRKVPWLIPVFGNGKSIKRPVCIEDVVAVLDRLVLREPLDNRIWEVAGPEAMTLDELIDLTAAHLNLRKHKIHIPLRGSLLLARVAEFLLGSRSPLTRDIILGLNEDVLFDTRPTLVELQLSPRSIRTGR